MGQNNETSNGMCMALAPSFSAAFSSVPADNLVKCSEYAPVLGASNGAFSHMSSIVTLVRAFLSEKTALE